MCLAHIKVIIVGGSNDVAQAGLLGWKAWLYLSFGSVWDYWGPIYGLLQAHWNDN